VLKIPLSTVQITDFWNVHKYAFNEACLVHKKVTSIIRCQGSVNNFVSVKASEWSDTFNSR